MSSTTSAATTTPAPPARAPALAAALVGLLAVVTALAVGHLVAGLLLLPAATPFLAVGNAAIDRTPGFLKDFAIAQFGTNDKLVLLLTMAVVIAGVAVLAGLASRRSALPGLVVVTVLGVVGILAVLEQAPGALSALAPVGALIAGVAVFSLLHRLAMPVTTGGDGGAQAGRPLRRRRFLAASGGVALGAALSGVAGTLLANRIDVAASRRAVGALVPAVPAPPIPAGASFPGLATPPFLTPPADFYRIDINLQVPQLRAEDHTLRIHGLVDREIELTFDDIRSRPLVEKTITMTCVSNFVGGPLVSTSNFVGVSLADLIAEAGPRPEATLLVGRSADGFTIGTPLQRVIDAGDEALLAIGMDREALLPEHGFPMRTVVPGLYGYVSATKWITELELTTFDFDAYWEERGWDGDPEGIVPIKISARVDTPGQLEKVPAGEITFAGSAWAQGRGIERVELRFDGGDWEEAELGTEVNINTWRMWRARRTLEPGLHAVAVRAVDRSGEVQTGDRAEPINPGPDGTTGWHTVNFTVA